MNKITLENFAKTKPRTKHMARISILAQSKKIKEALEQGYSKKLIFEWLTANNEINCSYIVFCKTIKNYIASIDENTDKTTKQQSVEHPKQPRKAQSQNQIKKFNFNNEVDKDSLI